MNRVKFKELELDGFKAFLNSQVDHTKADVDTCLYCMKKYLIKEKIFCINYQIP